MKPDNKKVGNLVLWTFIFFVAGVILYGSLYELALLLIKTSSKGGVAFQGEFPMLFIHSLLFGLVFCVIPGSVFICHQLIRGKSAKDYAWTCVLYLLFFATALWGVCDFESFFIVASNDKFKTNQVASHNVNDIPVNGIFIIVIILASIFTSFANMIKWLRAPKPKPKPVPKPKSSNPFA